MNQDNAENESPKDEDLSVVNESENSKKKISIPKSTIKKAIRFVIFGIIFSFLVYKMFFSEENEDIKNINNIKNKSTSNDIKFENRPKGMVSKKENEIEEISVQDVKLTKKAPPVLESPDLPQIDKINYFPTDRKDANLNEIQKTENNQNDDKEDKKNDLKDLLEVKKDDKNTKKEINFNEIDNIDEIAGKKKLNDNQAENNSINKGSPVVSYDSLSIDQKRRMSMFAIKGSSSPVEETMSKGKSGSNIKDFVIFDKEDDKKADNSSQQKPVKIKATENTISKGKIIKGVIENAINSSLQGSIRAIVSYDIYGESGRKILIPRGSRLYGQYSTTISIGQSRLAINWTELLRPDGLKISLNAYASDQFGRAGIEGDVDSRFLDSVKNSMMVSLLSIGTAVALEKIVGTGGQSQVVNNNGSVATTNITPANAAAQSMIQTVSTLANDMLKTGQTLAPVISLPQGILINIIVDQDIVVPNYEE